MQEALAVQRVINRGMWGHEVKEGTKGSRQYVADRMGEEWAAAMEGA